MPPRRKKAVGETAAIVPTVDRLHALPPEILERCLQPLEGHEAGLRKLAQTSKAWRDRIAPKLYETFDVVARTADQQPLQVLSLACALPAFVGYIRRVDISLPSKASEHAGIAQKLAVVLRQTWSNHAKLTLGPVGHGMSSTATLQSLAGRSLPPNVTIYGCRTFSALDCEALAYGLGYSNVVVLRLHSVSVIHTSFVDTLASMPSLKALSLQCVEASVSRFDDRKLVMLALQYLHFEEISGRAAFSLLTTLLARAANTLRGLKLGGEHCVGQEQLVAIAASSRLDFVILTDGWISAEAFQALRLCSARLVWPQVGEHDGVSDGVRRRLADFLGTMSSVLMRHQSFWPRLERIVLSQVLQNDAECGTLCESLGLRLTPGSPWAGREIVYGNYSFGLRGGGMVDMMNALNAWELRAWLPDLVRQS